MTTRSTIALLLLLLAASYAMPLHAAGDTTPLGIALEGYPYPHPVRFHPVSYFGDDLRMAYMDVPPPANANGRTVVLMHGANFFGAYWHRTIGALTAAGYRVVVPDQIGFGKSSKPVIPYSFHWLASNTKSLLDSLGIQRTSVVAHSMGGMLATRFTLMYPQTVERLTLANPIGLEDYRVKVPWIPAERIYQAMLKRTETNIRAYHESYYVEWKPEYDEYVMVHARMQDSAQFPQFARVRAQIAQMIYEQPVVYEFPLLRTPTLLIIGQQDRTALGKARVSNAARATLGQYPQLGRQAHAAIKGSRLLEWGDAGHAPQLEVPERFHDALLEFLAE
ncbi:MAG: alpha/beta hydrolase [Betaproteobacteria bacterium]|jgi:pimeloyl-ACP methyl ester carboxylesterase|nr:MAG: alpha/beta hydrolase [Betaproteobacteria bacterium]